MGNGEDDVLKRALEHPPVVESVAGIEFRARGMDVVSLVRESQDWSAEYPIVTAQPPLAPSRPVGQPDLGVEFQFSPGLPPTRLWSASPDQEWLLQSQDDRVVLNWRRMGSTNEYPRYTAMRRALLDILTRTHRPNGSLVPLVAEFSYVNQITGSIAGLHDIYSIFRKPDPPVPGEIVGARYEVVTREKVAHGFAQLNVSIQPTNLELGATTLTVSTRVFVDDQPEETDIIDLVDSAHAVSKKAFFAIVSPSTTERWGTADGA